MQLKYLIGLLAVLILGLYSCKEKPKTTTRSVMIYKGMYSFGPEEKSFKDCSQGRVFWVTDSSAQLELQYSELHFEKPYVPVYIEVAGKKIASRANDVSATFDSTLVVTKVLKITKEIPKDCN